MKIKLREVTRHFINKNDNGNVTIAQRYCIEILHGRKWSLLGGAEGVYKFDTKEARDTKLAELRESVATPAASGAEGEEG